MPTLAIIGFLSNAHLAFADDIYISPSGDDSHPGTSDQPFKTLVRARDQVRKMSAGMNADIHIWLADGVYPQATTLTSDARDSGQNFLQYYLRSPSGAHPVVSGGREIQGWIRAQGAVPYLKKAKQTSAGYVLDGKCPLNDWTNISRAEFVYNFLDGGSLGGGQWIEPRLGIDRVVFADGKTTIVMKQPGYAHSCSTVRPSSGQKHYRLLSSALAPSRLSRDYSAMKVMSPERKHRPESS